MSTPSEVDHPRLFDDSDRAPYLAVSSTEIQNQKRLDDAQNQKQKQLSQKGNKKNEDGSSKEEADAAAGGGQSVLKRVSSFSILNNKSPSFASRLEEAASRSSVNRTQGEEPKVESLNATRPSWRLRDRMKTVGIGMVMSLNIGTGM